MSEHTPCHDPVGLEAPLAEHRCPLCGGPNGCATAASGRFDVACWCTSVRVPAEVLARVPAEQRGRACVCQRCTEAATIESRSSTTSAGQ